MSRRAAGGAARRERGAAAVEMAIIFPLMFLVLAGIVDLGRGFFYQIQLTNAAREGVRTAAMSTAATTAEVEANILVRARSSAPAVPDLSTSVPLPQLCVAGGGGDAEVTASTPMEWYLLEPAMNIIQLGNVLPNSLSSTARMRCGG